MAGTGFEKYLVTEPLWEAGPGVTNRQSPTMTFMSSTQVAEANCYIEFGWIWGMPEPNPHVHEHIHSFDEIVVHIGGDPDDPEDLGAEVEYYLGGQPLTFTTTSAIFVPKGVRHGPHTWKKYRKPHIGMAIMVGAGSSKEAWGPMSGIRKAKAELPRKSDDVDYEKYLVRKPAYGRMTPAGGRKPAMTMMSNNLVPEASHYIELGWVVGVSDPDPHVSETTHKCNEIIFHIGGDMNHPLELGGLMEFMLGGQPLVVDKTCGLWVPKGVKHGPLTWKRSEKPHLRMSFLIGCGGPKEG